MRYLRPFKISNNFQLFEDGILSFMDDYPDIKYDLVEVDKIKNFNMETGLSQGSGTPFDRRKHQSGVRLGTPPRFLRMELIGDIKKIKEFSEFMIPNHLLRGSSRYYPSMISSQSNSLFSFLKKISGYELVWFGFWEEVVITGAAKTNMLFIVFELIE